MDFPSVPPRAPTWAIAIAASAGGIPALNVVFGGLPGDLPASILLVQHLERRRAHSHLSEILARHSALEIEEAREGVELRTGCVYVAPPDRHLVLRATRRIGLSDAPLVHFVRPAADVLFPSVAACFGARTIAVVLSGSGQDGAIGAATVHEAGGIVIAQDEATSQHFSMPRAAIALGHADYVLPVESIPERLISLTTAHVQN